MSRPDLTRYNHARGALNAGPVDLTAFMWDVRALPGGRLRIDVFCAPRKAPNLSKKVRHEISRCRNHGRGTIRLDHPQLVAAFVEWVEDRPELVSAYRNYASQWAGAKQGQKVSEATLEGRRAAARHCLALSWHP